MTDRERVNRVPPSTVYQYSCGCEYGHVIVATGESRWERLWACLSHREKVGRQ